jgi:Periplasmic copper-binding protein (NosD)
LTIIELRPGPLALAVTLPAAPAQAAGAARTFVSAAGNDSNNCTNVATPCRHLAAAHAATAANGEIYVLDPANYGSLTITGPVAKGLLDNLVPITISKGVTITVPPGVEAGIAAPSGGTAITIDATQNDAVVLRGLTLSGANSANYGIQANSAGKIEIVDSVIRDFKLQGIQIEISNTNTLLHISNTKVMNNADTGILVYAFSGSILTANFDHLTVIDNNNYGIVVGARANATIVNSNISNNGIGVVNGCNLALKGDISDNAFAVLQYLTPMPRGNQGCSLLQQGFSSGIISQVMGAVWQQKDSTDSMGTDGTNIISLPSHTVTTVRN